MKTQPFARRVIALMAVIGLAASAAYASPPDPTPLKAFDSGQQLRVTEFDTGQQHVAAAVIQKATDLGIAYAPKELDTSPQHETVPAALVVTPAANIDANAGTTPPIDTSPQPVTVIAATIVDSAIGIVAIPAHVQELDTSPPIGGQLVVISDALGIDNTDTGQPIAGHAGYQVLSLSA